MDTQQKLKLIEVYKRYGFQLTKDLARENILVFTLKTGYFDNAEIVKLTNDANTDSVFNELTRTGYACTIRSALSPEATQEELFKGFFSAESTRTRLIEEYRKFAETIVKPYGKGAKYEYIRAPYEINGKPGELCAPEEIINRINSPGPTLFLIEAAAGFGKTCTAQEIAHLLAQRDTHLPLYAELSRNRSARIFRYILLDEIDRSFPLLNSSLVQSEIKNGRIAAILDGFDELLRKSQDSGDFENQEPMLETISELLTGNAKVVITTRRTILFDGDEFHKWLERHIESFEVIRIRINEPRVRDWLQADRLEALTKSGLNMEAMANPVLLSYLRCIDEIQFSEASKNPDKIVDSYFDYMIEREKVRQELLMTQSNQSHVMQAIACDMIEKKYTAESRDYIINLLLTKHGREIDEARSQYSSTNRPSREEIANKLASHALLDRSASDPTKIGFVNEFALGNYVAQNIIFTKDWLDDDPRFIDPAVRSYAPRTQESKDQLFKGLESSLPYLDLTSQIEISCQLKKKIPADIKEGEAEKITFDQVCIGSPKINNFQFNDCTFRNCTIQRDGLNEVTFLNCKFYDCTAENTPTNGSIYLLGCTISPELHSELVTHAPEDTNQPDREQKVDANILKKFWPIGESTANRPSRPVFKPLKHLLQNQQEFNSIELFESVERLTRLGVIVEMTKSRLITLNLDNLSNAQKIIEGSEA